MKGCAEDLIGYCVLIVILGFLAAPHIIGAAAAAVPVVMPLAILFGGIWLLVRFLRSRWLSDFVERSAERQRAASARPAPAHVPASPVQTQTSPSQPSGGVLAHASGRPMRVYEIATGLGARPIWAEEYDDGRVRGYALYSGASGGVTILSQAEFARRYRIWNP